MENLAWCQHADRKPLGLFIPRSGDETLKDLSERLFERVKANSFKKTDFALVLLAAQRDEFGSCLPTSKRV